MKAYRDGQSSPYGLFVSLRPLDARFVGAEGEDLEGVPGAIYHRLPNVLAVAMAPVLGGMFVILFPLLVLLVSAAGLGRLLNNKLFGRSEAPSRLVPQGVGGAPSPSAGDSPRSRGADCEK